jgi:hypothetical protein
MAFSLKIESFYKCWVNGVGNTDRSRRLRPSFHSSSLVELAALGIDLDFHAVFAYEGC